MTFEEAEAEIRKPRKGRPIRNIDKGGSLYLDKIPRDVWKTFERRRAADSAKLGYLIDRKEIIRDLMRQYAEAVTYFGKRHVTPPPIFPAFARSK